MERESNAKWKPKLGYCYGIHSEVSTVLSCGKTCVRRSFTAIQFRVQSALQVEGVPWRNPATALYWKDTGQGSRAVVTW